MLSKTSIELQAENTELNSYLISDSAVDFSHPAIQEQAKILFHSPMNEEETIKTAFDFVCNEIPHSADIHSCIVSRTASEVLLNKEGICYAKSLLLAAFLRLKNIPTGFCYQSLRLDGTLNTELVIHALNAVWLSSKKCWMRIDARGNTNGINAQFIPGEEHLAFDVHPQYGEIDYPVIYAAPHPLVIKTLNAFSNCKIMFQHLPQTLSQS